MPDHMRDNREIRTAPREFEESALREFSRDGNFWQHRQPQARHHTLLDCLTMAKLKRRFRGDICSLQCTRKYEKRRQLDGDWHDVVIVKRIFLANLVS